MKYVSVVLVTAGIIICTLATSGLDDKKKTEKHEEDEGWKLYVEWMIGQCFLVAPSQKEFW